MSLILPRGRGPLLVSLSLGGSAVGPPPGATCDSGLTYCLASELQHFPSTPNFLSHPYDDINAAASPTREDGDGRLHHAEDEALLGLNVDRDPATDATKGHQEHLAPESL